jgi:3-oxoacyl-[acyl-carrier-protein] synthase II
VPVAVAGSALRTCLGDQDATFAALLEGRSGASQLSGFDSATFRVSHGYQIADGRRGTARARPLLTECLSRAIADSGLDLAGAKVAVLVGSGLRELRLVELAATAGLDVEAEELHFARAARAACPALDHAITISNACSAGGYALALGQDLLELGEADVAIVAAADTITVSMQTMISRVADRDYEHVRPFDAARPGVLLGEGAAALVLVRDQANGARCRVLATGLSCDAAHETAPDLGGICRAMRDALARAGRVPGDVDLVVMHGTGTRLNDPVETAAVRQVLSADADGPAITGVKGAVGHTSGAAALVNVIIAAQCLAARRIPPVVGLRAPTAEANDLDLVIGRPRDAALSLVQSNAFGFGGVNAVTLVGAA